MKVFIMWSGKSSKIVAEALWRLLRVVVQGPEYFLSSTSIEKGALWDDALGTELEETHFGIACLTAENLTSPWIHFEAGAIAKTGREARVFPYLVGLREANLKGPLTRFQATLATEKDTFRLVEAINGTWRDGKQNPLDVLEDAFAGQWQKLENAIKQAEETVEPSPANDKAETHIDLDLHDMVAELLEQVRALRRSEQEATPPKRKMTRKIKFHEGAEEYLKRAEFASIQLGDPSVLEKARSQLVLIYQELDLYEEGRSHRADVTFALSVLWEIADQAEKRVEDE